MACFLPAWRLARAWSDTHNQQEYTHRGTCASGGARKIDDGVVREFGWEGGTVTQSSQREEHRERKKKERKRKA
jgi:hypothetical protein